MFFADLCAALDLAEKAVETALIELVMAGLVTNDSLQAMRTIVTTGAPQPQARKPYSSLEAELAQRRSDLGLGTRALGRKPATAHYRSAKRRVRQRLERKEQAKPTRWVGRWSLVHRFSVMGKPISLGERVSRQARQLLARHGVVTRTCLESEAGSWEWGLLYRELQRLEMRGEVRRGYFVQGLPGVQFAMPDAVEKLRAIRDATDDVAPVVLNACDPANLYGPARDEAGIDIRTAKGEPLTFARVPTTWLVQHRGLPVLVAGNTGTNLVTVQGADEGILRQALSVLFAHLGGFERRVIVETWNEEPVLDSDGAALIEAVGGYRYYPGMAWESRRKTQEGRRRKEEKV